MSDIMVNEFDRWESHIREVERGAAEAIIEYGKRWREYYLYCKEHHGKQGGSMFAQFAKERFGYTQSTASHLAKVGERAEELSSITTKFAPDWTSMYNYTCLGDAQKTMLLESLEDGEKINQKSIKALAYGHTAGDEWYTPRWLFDALGIQFDIDVCAPADLTHVTTPANKYFNENDNGLEQPWNGTIWCNPPYSTPAPWALQCVEHGDGLLLTHIPMNAEWCMAVWNACAGIRLFQAIEFVRPDGKTQRPGSWLQLAAFGEVAYNALKNMEAPEDVVKNPRRVPSPMWVVV